HRPRPRDREADRRRPRRTDRGLVSVGRRPQRAARPAAGGGALTMPAFNVVAGIVNLLPALLWGIIAWHSWRLAHEFQLRMTLLRIAPIVAAVSALHFVLHALETFTPTELGG